MPTPGWTAELPVVQVRVARSTSRLKQVVRFYRDGIGLEVIGSFQGHSGYDGVMLGLPGTEYHLEFTQRKDGSDCPPPGRDNLLVLYIPDAVAIDRICDRLREQGQTEVEPENPYWKSGGHTFEDPDGWSVVLMRTAGIRGGVAS